MPISISYVQDIIFKCGGRLHLKFMDSVLTGEILLAKSCLFCS